jgi:hypothetical protein
VYANGQQRHGELKDSYLHGKGKVIYGENGDVREGPFIGGHNLVSEWPNTYKQF